MDKFLMGLIVGVVASALIVAQGVTEERIRVRHDLQHMCLNTDRVVFASDPEGAEVFFCTRSLKEGEGT